MANDELGGKQMRRGYLIVPIMVLVLAVSPAAAQAAHWYYRFESSEGYKLIPKTVHALFASNGAIEAQFLALNRTIVCHAEGHEKLFTNGDDQITYLETSVCSLVIGKEKVSSECTVTEVNRPTEKEFEEDEYPITQLTDSGGKYFDEVSELFLEWDAYGASCKYPGDYALLLYEGEWLQAEVDNGATPLALLFPESSASRATGVYGATFYEKGVRVVVSLDLSPLEGSSLRVGA